MSRTPELVRIERTEQSISTQVARALISAGVASSSRNTDEAVGYFEKAIAELTVIKNSLLAG